MGDQTKVQKVKWKWKENFFFQNFHAYFSHLKSSRREITQFIANMRRKMNENPEWHIWSHATTKWHSFFCVILNFSRKQSWGILGTKVNGDLFLYLAVGCFVHFSFCLLLDEKMQQFNNKRNLNFERRLCWKSLQ